MNIHLHLLERELRNRASYRVALYHTSSPYVHACSEAFCNIYLLTILLTLFNKVSVTLIFLKGFTFFMLRYRLIALYISVYAAHQVLRKSELGEGLAWWLRTETISLTSMTRQSVCIFVSKRMHKHSYMSKRFNTSVKQLIEGIIAM